MLGGLLGSWAYQFFIGFHQPDDPEDVYAQKVINQFLSTENQLGIANHELKSLYGFK
ncbi:unnamed protein product [Cylicostephanus goldi]|uniref:Uncharacterized protein n=1 Tax=Cylicostephanus goldi TaxID=71465 RepID=A0A3P6T2G1_CYLGO|nr:unnamed protein product [Cylicostephanus goldi]